MKSHRLLNFIDDFDYLVTAHSDSNLDLRSLDCHFKVKHKLE